jgi:hypothetical protein
MSAGPDVDVRASAPERTTDGANFAVEPYEQVFAQAMERMASITEEWSQTVRRFNPRA